MMNTAALTMPTLLAQSQSDQNKQHTLTTVTPSDVSDQFNQGIQHDLPWELLLVGLGATIVTIAVVSLRRWWLHRYKDPNPLVLYSAIARKAGLGWRDRYLLWRIAKACNLPTPITLLLARGALQHYAELYQRNRSAAARQRLDQRFAHIQRALFE